MLTEAERKELRDRFHGLSMVCWCRSDADERNRASLCSACREQMEIRDKLKGK